jgi:hypothetical protein
MGSKTQYRKPDEKRHCPDCGGHAPETDDTIFGKPVCQCEDCDERWHGDQTLPFDKTELEAEAGE